MTSTIFTFEDFNALSREQSKQIKQHESKKFWSKIVYTKDLSHDIKYSKILERGREVEQLHNEEKWANHEMDNDFTQKNQAIAESWSISEDRLCRICEQALDHFSDWERQGDFDMLDLYLSFENWIQLHKFEVCYSFMFVYWVCVSWVGGMEYQRIKTQNKRDKKFNENMGLVKKVFSR